MMDRPTHPPTPPNKTKNKQVRHAQHAGASGVLVADNLCVCKDISCHPDPGTTCQVRTSGGA